jgi:hypothetical protein
MDEAIDNAREYVRGNVHAIGLENFWSLLKRGIRGTYISVEPFHLFRNLDEQAFRFEERENNDSGGRVVDSLDHSAPTGVAQVFMTTETCLNQWVALLAAT